MDPWGTPDNTGIHCQPDALQKITFPSPRSTDNYAKLNTTFSTSQELTSFTLCLHMRTYTRSSRKMGLVSYAVKEQNNELRLYRDGDTFRLYVSGASRSVNLPVWDGEWHAICATWRSSNGAWQIYSDGVLRRSRSGLKTGKTVRSGGTWILGQDQDSVGGGFEEDQAFSGELSQVNLWDRVLSPAEIATNWTVSCNNHGNVINWTAIDIDVFGNANSDKYDCASETPEYTSLGCWKDKFDRAIPTLEGTDPLLKDNYGTRTDAIEKCYLVAFSGESTVFAIQNGGWCVTQRYIKYGRSTACSGDGEGGPWANQVYQITAVNTTNIALNRLANQSSTDDRYGGAAGRAIDGNRNTDYDGKSCTRTTNEPNPWWRVDLGSTKFVDRVVVVNREDSSNRLNGFQVHVGDNSRVMGNPTCGGAQSVSSRDVVFIINCGGLTGRYVGITLPRKVFLTLCEVEVYGGRFT
ncbi:uncharacterized protein [Branchiostoma lanceolatum]|uniref:uncharacterized protein n=1 Tax=Branchiostoma lanceolatum TaxID=7740 RepID=UPI0034553027